LQLSKSKMDISLCKRPFNTFLRLVLDLETIRSDIFSKTFLVHVQTRSLDSDIGAEYQTSHLFHYVYNLFTLTSGFMKYDIPSDSDLK